MKTLHHNSIFLMVSLGVILWITGFGVGHWSRSWPWLASDSESPRDDELPTGQTRQEADGLIPLSQAHQQEWGVVATPCGPGVLTIRRTFPGEIELNADRSVRLSARVNGVVHRIHKALGDTVQAGDALAVIQSPDLAALRAAYLGALERQAVTEATFNREKDLRAQTMTSEQSFQEAAAALAEDRIALRNAEQGLLCLGCTPESLGSLADLPAEAFGDYTVTAPWAGTLIDRLIAVGQAVEPSSEVFALADLSGVWADLSVPADAGTEIHPGQAVVVTDSLGQVTANAEITYVAPVIDEATRTLRVRVNLPNPDGQWRPGQFITARVTTAWVQAAIVVPRAAVQPVEDRFYVFVRTDQGFVPHVVSWSQSDEASIAILSGLEPGQPVVTSGAFTLKAQWLKETFGGDDD